VNLADEIRERVRAAYDPELARAIHREMCYVYGADETVNQGIATTGDLLITFPDVTSSTQEIGKVRKSLKSTTAFLSRLMSSRPLPVFTGIHEINKSIREAYWLGRWDGDGDSFDGLSTHVRDTWMSGWNHGFTGTWFGLATDRRSKKQKVVGGMMDPRYTIIDPVCKDPRNADWVCWFEPWPIYKANQIFDPATVEARKMRVGRTATSGESQWVVMVGTYYDTGLGKLEPKMAYFLGGLEHKPVQVRAKPFERMPLAWMTHTLLPGMRRHIGQVVMMQAAEEAVNLFIDMLKRKARRGEGWTAINPKAITPESLAMLRTGNHDGFLVMADDYTGELPPATHIPQSPVDRVVMDILQLMMQELNEQMGLSEVGRGNASNKEQTKFEVAMIEQNSRANTAGPEYSTRVYLIDCFKRVFELGRDFDRHPFEANIAGQQIPFNVEGEPASSLGVVLAEKAQVALAEDTLLIGGRDAAKRAQMQEFGYLMQTFGSALNLPELLSRVLQTLQIPDPDSLIRGGEASANAEQEQMAQPGQAGQDPAQLIAAMMQGQQ
jgi:hypothetical protein